MTDTNTPPALSLAIVGMAGRFPGARNVTQFWQNLIHGVKAIRQFDDNDLLAAGVERSRLDLPNYVKAGTVLDGIDRFDAPFFGFTPREAETMDPQTRLFLQCAWEVLEDAACDPETYPGLIGVFGGKGFPRYLTTNLLSNPELMELTGELQLAVGTERDALASLIAYKLDLKGPSISVQTFCSTSLVAVHLACQSLLAYECDMALAGGAAIDIPQGQGYLYQEGGILSPDGECRALDANANGSVLGNGVGMVAIKRLEDALADRDHIYAVIRGTASNNDGNARVGFTAPGVQGQAAVIASALGNAGVDARTIGYIETHGTGTPLGDSVELSAMRKVFGQAAEAGFCAIGSLKPNVGHLDRASGVANLIKAALAVQHRQLPPSLNCESPNAELEGSPFYVNTTLQEWARPEAWPRRAGVSSFGLGGTNAHVVLEEAPHPEPTTPALPAQLLVLSAKTEGALESATHALAQHLSEHPELELADVAYTLQVGRTLFNHRRMLVAHDLPDAVAALTGEVEGRVFSAEQTSRDRPTAFYFSDVQGGDISVPVDLYRHQPSFRAAVDACCDLLGRRKGTEIRTIFAESGNGERVGCAAESSIRAFSWGGSRGRGEPLWSPRWRANDLHVQKDQAKDMARKRGVGRLRAGDHKGAPLPVRHLWRHRSPNATLRSNSTRRTRSVPALMAPVVGFIAQYALARQFLDWGIEPSAVHGTGIGQLTAACVAEMIRLEDALALLEAGGHGADPASRAAAVNAAARDIANRNAGRCRRGELRSPGESCIAGNGHVQHNEAAGERSSPLRSQEESLHPYATSNGRQEAPIPSFPAMDSIQLNDLDICTPDYWSSQASENAATVSTVDLPNTASGYIWVEIGTGATRIHGIEGFTQGDQPALDNLLTTVGDLWLSGAKIDWTRIWRGQRRNRISLPTYPFADLRYWVEARALPAPSSHAIEPAACSLKKPDIADWFYKPVWNPASLTANDGIADPSSWLIFADDLGLGSQLAESLDGHGSVIQVTAGEECRLDPDGTYVIRPDRRDDYRALVRALNEAGRLPGKILHLWSLTRDPASHGRDPFSAPQTRGFYSLIYLAQALGDHLTDAPLEVIAVTNNAQAVSGKDMQYPEAATIRGVCKSLAQESLTVRCRSVDFDLTDETADHTVIEQLTAEVLSASADREVAYRGRQRFALAYEPCRLEATSQTTFRRGGTYLITGAFGGVGTILAEYLARTVGANLVLVGRSALPARDAWDAWPADHGPDDAVSRRIASIRRMEAMGSNVLAVQADVADPVAMREAVRTAHERFGTLHGVLHLAGISDRDAFESVSAISTEQCERHFGPKAYGLYALAEALAEEDLEVCLLFSSLSSVLGGLGFVAYTAANIFVDAFCRFHNAHSAGEWLSVNWDTWHTRDDQHADIGGSVAAYEMTPAEGCEALERILANPPDSQIVESTGDLESRLRQWILLEPVNGGAPGTNRTTARRDLPTAYVPANSEYERKIAQIWQDLLGIEGIGIYDNFFDLGGNSLIGLTMVAQIKKQLGVQIPVVTLFEAPTINALAKHLQPAQEPANVTLQERRKRARRTEGDGSVAIIGMAARFPGARDVGEFWENLRNGVESVARFRDEELLASGVAPELLANPQYVKARPIIEGADLFDAPFFGFNPREAELTDPQQRVFLECAWQALETAGYDPRTYPGRIGMIGGTNISTYMLGLASNPEAVKTLGAYEAAYQIAVGNDKDALATAVSYKLNLRGPSLTIQTFCSTSLVAVHLGCQSLLNGECDMAMAGGVSVRVPVKAGYLAVEGGMESPDGHCRTFDARAQGTMFGDGAGIVVLKRLEDALEDGDQIYAVIRGSAINNDGSLKVGYAAPSVEGQVQVIEAALDAANVSPESIQYIEAHGTATRLGDPIEVTALTRAFRKTTDAAGYCALGSVKTNIGHVDRAAGVSGLIKTALSLQHGLIPPSLHFETPNPELDIEHSPFYVNTALAPWPSNGQPRRAGVSSLGMGGTNAHVILEEAPPLPATTASRPWQLLVLSARTASALEEATGNLADYLRDHPDADLADVAFTLQSGRTRFDHRRVLICRDGDDARQELTGGSPRLLTSEQKRNERPVAFMFPGLGDQYVDMARELYDVEPVFRAELDRCFAYLKGRLDLDLKPVIFSPESGKNGHNSSVKATDLRGMLGRGGARDSALEKTENAQPAVFVIEYALARLLAAWGIQPQAMIGYSLGEYVAACVAGVLSLEDALTLVTRRARLIGDLPRGAMLAVGLPAAEVEAYLNPALSLAGVNGPKMSILSGTEEAVAELERRLTAEGIACRPLVTSHAFHSHMMDPVASEVEKLVAGFDLAPPRIPYVSNVTGTWITPEQATDPGYWAQHLRGTVQFADGVRELLGDPEQVLLEVGPGRMLSSIAKLHPDCTPERAPLIIPTLRHSYESTSDVRFLLETLGKLWLLGARIDWAGFYRDERRRRCALPTYPFQRQRYWLDAVALNAGAALPCPSTNNATIDDILDRELPKIPDLGDWFFTPSWERLASRPPVTVESLAQNQERWLLFTDECGLGDRLAGRLRAAGHTVTTVCPGTEFEQRDEQHFQVRPDDRDDCNKMLRAMQKEDGLPTRVLHMWSVTPERRHHVTAPRVASTGTAGRAGPGDSPVSRRPRLLGRRESLRLGERKRRDTASRSRPTEGIPTNDHPSGTTPIHRDVSSKTIRRPVTPEPDETGLTHDLLTETLRLGFYSVLSFAQAYADIATEPCRIAIISSDMQDVTDTTQLQPAKATLLGPYKVIQQEYTQMRCSSIDITVPAAGSRQETELIEGLLAEVVGDPTPQPLALRGRSRWRQIFQPIPLASEDGTGPNLRDGGVYLITGGLGGIGLAIAEYLVRQVHAKVVLVGRSGLPPREHWPELIADGEEERIRKVLALEELGGEVLPLAADVTDRAQMKAVIDRTLERFGSLHGVIHAAGVPAAGLTQFKDNTRIAAVMAPKVQGTLVLHELLQDVPLDFLVLFSSIAAYTGGGPGQIEYSAANAFLGAFARRYEEEHGRTVAIDWGEWQWDAWGAGLEGFPPDARAFFVARRERFGISFEDGCEALRRALAHRQPEVIVSTQDFREMVKGSSEYSASMILDEVRKGQKDRPRYPRPALGTSYVEPRNDLERQIAEMWSDLLGVGEIGIDDNFFELGGNSLIGVDLIMRLRRECGVSDLPVYTLYEAPSVREMAKQVGPNEDTPAGAGLAAEAHARGASRLQSVKRRQTAGKAR